jgi:hypothetical protein
LLHLVGFDFIALPTLKMHGQTQIKKKGHKSSGVSIVMESSCFGGITVLQMLAVSKAY